MKKPQSWSSVGKQCVIEFILPKIQLQWSARCELFGRTAKKWQKLVGKELFVILWTVCFVFVVRLSCRFFFLSPSKIFWTKARANQSPNRIPPRKLWTAIKNWMAQQIKDDRTDCESSINALPTGIQTKSIRDVLPFYRRFAAFPCRWMWCQTEGNQLRAKLVTASIASYFYVRRCKHSFLVRSLWFGVLSVLHSHLPTICSALSSSISSAKIQKSRFSSQFHPFAGAAAKSIHLACNSSYFENEH